MTVSEKFALVHQNMLLYKPLNLRTITDMLSLLPLSIAVLTIISDIFLEGISSLQ